MTKSFWSRDDSGQVFVITPVVTGGWWLHFGNGTERCFTWAELEQMMDWWFEGDYRLEALMEFCEV